jgi:glycerate kinase
LSRPKVLVVTDGIGKLGSDVAGAALARGFAELADVAVVPVAIGGRALAEATAALTGGTLNESAGQWVVRAADLVLIGLAQPPQPGWAPDSSTAGLGDWVLEALRGADPAKVVIDLTGVTAQDGGVGLLAQAAAALAGRQLIGIVASDELELAATGLTGAVARRGYAAGRDVAEVLAADAQMKALVEGFGAGLALAPGGGAAGGCGAAILSLGGWLLDGPQFCHSLADLDASLARCDLVVTGCGELSALDRGGPIVSSVAEWAERAQRPCIAFAGGEELSRREVRTFGLEAAHQLGALPSASELTQAASRVATGWFGR